MTKQEKNGGEEKKTNCPNCGAPISGDSCQYCGTVIWDFATIELGKPQWIKVKHHVLEVSCERLREQPTVDAVEVVRCKDCRHFDRESWDEPMNLLPSYCLKKLPGIGYGMYGNGPESYCSYGERGRRE